MALPQGAAAPAAPKAASLPSPTRLALRLHGERAKQERRAGVDAVRNTVVAIGRISERTCTYKAGRDIPAMADLLSSLADAIAAGSPAFRAGACLGLADVLWPQADEWFDAYGPRPDVADWDPLPRAARRAAE